MERFENIMIYREGDIGSKMETNHIVMILEPNKNYIFSEGKFISTDNFPETKIYKINKPPITTITGEWNNNKIIKSTSLNNLDKLIHSEPNSNNMFEFDSYYMDDSSSEEENITNKNTFSNILGNNVKFNCDNNYYYFKPIIATNENVSYYNCKIIDEGETFNFDSPEIMALFNMNISFNYIKDYIMDESKGGGIYLEYHNLPHIHIPLNDNSSGYIILAKQKKSNIYDVSAFKIPYGKALYIPPNIIHNDCFLIGDYNVVYGKSTNYSTAILKEGEKLVNFNFLN